MTQTLTNGLHRIPIFLHGHPGTYQILARPRGNSRKFPGSFFNPLLPDMNRPVLNKRFSLTWILALLAWLSISPAVPGLAQPPEETLRWRFQEGNRFLARVNQKTVTSTTVDRRSVRMFSNATIEFDWVVTGVVDTEQQGVATIEQTIRSIRLEVENPEFPGQAILLDTGSPQRPRRESLNLLRQVEPLIGLKLIARMSARGELLDLQAPAETLESLSQLPDSLKLQELISQPGLSKMLAEGILLLPSEPQSVGSRWETVDSVDNPFGQFARVRRYEYAENEVRNDRRLAIIKLTSQHDLTRGKPRSEEAGTLLNQSETGTMTFNLTEGHFMFSEIQSQVETQFPYVDELIRSDVQSTYTMTLERVE